MTNQFTMSCDFHWIFARFPFQLKSLVKLQIILVTIFRLAWVLMFSFLTSFPFKASIVDSLSSLRSCIIRTLMFSLRLVSFNSDAKSSEQPKLLVTWYGEPQLNLFFLRLLWRICRERHFRTLPSHNFVLSETAVTATLIDDLTLSLLKSS